MKFNGEIYFENHIKDYLRKAGEYLTRIREIIINEVWSVIVDLELENKGRKINS